MTTGGAGNREGANEGGRVGGDGEQTGEGERWGEVQNETDKTWRLSEGDGEQTSVSAA